MGAPEDLTPELPRGIVTFCLTDIEGSTAMWDRDPEAMAKAVARHDALVGRIVAMHGGALVQSQGEGDSTLTAFPTPAGALRAAAAIHETLAADPSEPHQRVRVRIGVHTGEAEIRDGKYFGAAVNRAARLRGLGAGGQTVVSAATAELTRDHLPAGFELRDAGRHELRGFARPEHAFVLCEMGAATGASAVVSGGDGEDPTRSVRVAATSFVGRDADRALLAELLTTNRLVTVTGPGGCGKTRLAVEVASRRSRRATGAQRVVAVDLSPVTEPDLVPPILGAALGSAGVPESAEEAVAAVAASLARSDALIVLDNCEQVVSVVASIAHEFVRQAATASMLVTSQLPLGVAGEQVYPLAGLSLGSAGAGQPGQGGEIGEPAWSDAVRLFIERARARDASFSPDEAEVGLIAALCRRLDGMPLAIELAAAQAHVLAPAEILARLETDPATILSSSAPDTAARQRSVGAAIARSVSLLDDADRVLLCRLSVFEGGFTSDAAEAVCGAPPLESARVLTSLTRLVDRSLVARRRGPRQVRFWLLQTIREHARERLAAQGSSGNSAAVLRREGEVWVIAGPGGRVLFKDAVGLRYLACLLSKPGREAHVLDLVAGEHQAAATPAPDRPLDILDGAARKAYADRIRDLQAEMDDARDANDPARAEAVEVEIEAIAGHLLGATGLGGRGRKAAGTVERARVSVTKAIRGTIRQVSHQAPEIGHHLDVTIRTGTFCSYQPGGESPITVATGLGRES